MRHAAACAEREILDHPDVLDCAAIGVPGHLGEEEMKVFVVRSAGSLLTVQGLTTYVASMCAPFVVPRYVEFVDELPKTQATDRAKKAELREREGLLRQRGVDVQSQPVMN